MAEALAFGASVVAFVQLTDRVVQLSKRLIDATKDAPTALRRLHAEVSSMKDIVTELQRLHDAANSGNSTAIEKATRQPIDSCQASVQMLEMELSKLSISSAHAPTGSHKRQKIKQSLKWAAGGEERVKKLVADMITQKATLSLALVTDISQDVKDVKVSVGKVENHLTVSQRQDILKWLEHTNPSEVHNRSRRLYEKHTGNWVLRSAEWADFVGGVHRTLWIHGIPGAGKTILCSNLVEMLHHYRKDRRVGWAYYYCYFGRNQDETGPLLRWITGQLCNQAAYIPKELAEAFRERHEPDTDQLLSILAAVLQPLDAAYVTIDAIDESMPYTNLLDALRSLMTESRFSKLRLLVTSRQYLDIEQCIKPCAVSLPMSNDLVAEDLRIYVASKLRSNEKFAAWPAILIQEVEDSLVLGAKGMFRWAVCQVDILGRLKTQSAVRKALTELPETLDETYERILLGIPQEHREFARSTLAILAAQSELGDHQMTAQVVLSMVVHSLALPDDNFYNVFDIRETCGCLVTFVPAEAHAYDPDKPDFEKHVSSEEVDEVILAHYTVKEFLYTKRTALNSKSQISRFALQEQTINREWADLVLHTALSARACDRIISRNSIEDYCLATGRYIIKTWEEMVVENDLADACLDLVNPARPHHLRKQLPVCRILHFTWFTPPTVSRVAALTECYAKGWFLLANAALRALDARQIIETPLHIRIDQKRPHPTRPQTTETCLLMLFFNKACSNGRSYYSAGINDERLREIIKHLAPIVGWESLLLAAVVEHNHGSLAGSALEWIVKQGADVNSSPCRLTPLQAAVQLRDQEAVKMLLETGADVNAVGSTAGYKVPGTGLNSELVLDSPLRVLRRAPCAFDGQIASRLRREVGRMNTTKATLEKLLLDAGARDFTAAP